MRRRPGVAGLQAAAGLQSQFRAVGEAAAESEAAHVAAKLVQFRSSLETFALKHRSEIREDPVFRAQFQAMCAAVGVDPLASNKGFWNELLGVGDFYYELAVQVGAPARAPSGARSRRAAEACLRARAQTGGLMELAELVEAVRVRRGAAAARVSEDDVLRAVQQLRQLGGGWDVLTVAGRRLVRSVPTELSSDATAALEAAAQNGGGVSCAALAAAAGWAAERAQAALDALLREGVALLDTQAEDGEALYWFAVGQKA